MSDLAELTRVLGLLCRLRTGWYPHGRLAAHLSAALQLGTHDPVKRVLTFLTDEEVVPVRWALSRKGRIATLFIDRDVLLHAFPTFDPDAIEHLWPRLKVKPYGRLATRQHERENR